MLVIQIFGLPVPIHSLSKERGMFGQFFQYQKLQTTLLKKEKLYL
jgi:hypothetical protein